MTALQKLRHWKRTILLDCTPNVINEPVYKSILGPSLMFMNVIVSIRERKMEKRRIGRDTDAQVT
jgi:hypothetical protein